MSENIRLRIDGEQVSVPPGTSLLKAAEQVGLEIPVLCYFDHTTANGLCRLCVVENENDGGMQAACVTAVREGAEISTRTERVERVRRTILEMLGSSVDLSESKEIQDLLRNYKAQPNRFDGGEIRQHERIDDNPVYIRDYSQCVLCWRCVQVCAEDAQYTYAINFSGRGFHTSIATFFDKPMTQTTCVFCGQCIGVCPTGALKAKREHLLEQGVSSEVIFEQTRTRGLGRRSRGEGRSAGKGGVAGPSSR